MEPRRRLRLAGLVLFTWFALSSPVPSLAAGPRPRARDLGVPFEGVPGPSNGLTDVPGVEVGHTTMISGEGPLKVGEGPVRTGVTAILPRGKASTDPVFAACFALNGNGEMTGTSWVEESGQLSGPVLLTNTCSVGTVHDAAIAWQLARRRRPIEYLPVVAETWDGRLNDINGFHVKAEHVFAALDGSGPGPVVEGNVGGGTGMVCYGFKGGIGTASRRARLEGASYLVGVLVQANHGRSHQLTVAGVPVGRELALTPRGERESGSILIIIATDAPLLPHQLKRIARRATLGLARTGSTSGDGSGDLFLAFSTAPLSPPGRSRVVPVSMLVNSALDPLFEATVQATEEAIVNALIAAETMKGINGHEVRALPHDALVRILKEYRR